MAARPRAAADGVAATVAAITFSRALEPPLSSTCRYIAFDRLRSEVARVGSLVRHLKPDFIRDLSEDCSLDGAK
jgi:hypothetical protein